MMEGRGTRQETSTHHTSHSMCATDNVEGSLNTKLNSTQLKTIARSVDERGETDVAYSEMGGRRVKWRRERRDEEMVGEEKKGEDGPS